MPEFVAKVTQLHDCKVARHGNMLVGRTGSGKSEAWRCLQRALGRLAAAFPDEPSFQRVHVSTINPLALSNDELYGSFEEVRRHRRGRTAQAGRAAQTLDAPARA